MTLSPLFFFQSVIMINPFVSKEKRSAEVDVLVIMNGYIEILSTYSYGGLE